MSTSIPVSLQSKLVKTTLWSGVVAGVIAFVLLILLTVYHNMNTQDEIMDEISDLLLMSDVHLPSGPLLDELSDEFDIQYVLYWQGEELNHSKNYEADHFKHDFKSDFSLVWLDGQAWRVYYQEKSKKGLSAVVIQPLSIRLDEIWQSLIWFFVVLIVIWILQWGLVRWGIHRDLTALRQLSQSITTKSANDLQPITGEIRIVEIEPVIHSLNQLLSRLNRSLKAEQAFTADASHELRSPLSAIQMRLQLIQRKYEDNTELKSDLAKIKIDVNRSIQILENLLLLARLDPTQEQELNKSNVDFTALVLDVIDALKLFAHNRKIELKLNVNVVSTIIFANPELIFTCVRNLLDNAIRYATAESSISIDIDTIQRGQRMWVKLTICNEGEPIEQEFLDRLGQRFLRGLGTGQQGTGLGLSITQKIVELHHGELHLTARQHGGLLVQLLF